MIFNESNKEKIKQLRSLCELANTEWVAAPFEYYHPGNITKENPGGWIGGGDDDWAIFQSQEPRDMTSFCHADKAECEYVTALHNLVPKIIAENTELRKAGAILLRTIYESGIANENVEVMKALEVFSNEPL